MTDPDPTPRRYRLAMVCSHAVQYFMPWFRRLQVHPRIDLTVVLGDDHGLGAASYDPGFGRAIRWDVPLTEGLKVELLRNHAPRPGVGRFLGIVNLDLLRVLTRDRFDAVVIHGWNYALYPLALLSARLHGLPVLMRGESPLLPGDPPLRGPDLRSQVRTALVSRYLGQCAAALAVSSGNRRLLLSYGMPASRVFLCPYAIDAGHFALSEDARAGVRAEWRARLGLAPQTALILSVGKLQPVKDPGLLLSAYAALRAAGADAALALVGDGELMEPLKAQAAAVPDVHFLGFRNQTELPALYAAADVFVLPSVRETFGLVVNEAMLAGLPVVCSDTVGCAEDLVRPGQTGAVFHRERDDQAGNVGRLVEQLRPLCLGPDAPARRRRLGDGAAALIKSWSYDEATAGLLAALDAVLPAAAQVPPTRSHS